MTLPSEADFTSQCVASLNSKTKLVSFEKDPGEVFYQVATDKVLLGHPSLLKLPHAQKSAATHRALLMVMRLNAQINLKSVIDFTKEDVPRFCKHAFSSVCDFVKPLRAAYQNVSGVNALQSKSVFILQCSEWLKNGQQFWDADYFPLNIFSYTDFCVGLHSIFGGLSQKQMLGNTDKVCDLVYTYILELFLRDQIIYTERYCSNSPFLANPDFKLVCKRGLQAVPNLKAWVSDETMTNICNSADTQRRKDCGTGAQCNYCALMFSQVKSAIPSTWNLLTGRMFSKQVTIQEVKILHTQALVETISQIMASAADTVLQEDSSRDEVTNPGREAVEAVGDVVARSERNQIVEQRIKNKLKDKKAKN